MFVSQDRQIFLAIYVDDLLIFGSDDSCLIDTQDKLNAQFKMINLREISHYLGIEVDVDVGKKISLRQTTYLKKVLERFQMTNCRAVSIFINLGVAHFFPPSEKQADQATIKWYQSVISSLVWSPIHTQPDISHSFGVLNRYCVNPGSTHYNLLI